MKRFVELAVKVIEQEINRQEAKGKIESAKYEGVEVYSIGKDFHLARSGKALLASNNLKAIQSGLDLLSGKEKKSVADLPTYAEAAKLLPKEPMAKLWVNLEEVHQRPEVKEGIQAAARAGPDGDRRSLYRRVFAARRSCAPRSPRTGTTIW